VAPIVERTRAAVDRIRTHASGHSLATQLATGAAWLAAALVLTALYTRLSMTSAISSDQANQALQGLDISRGNVLLRGWTLSTVSFYVPDLLLYALVIPLAGLLPMSIHLVNALVYAMAMVAAMVLAAGARGAHHRLAAGLVAGVLLVAPPLGLGVTMLLVGGSHVGVGLLWLLCVLVLDRSRRAFPALVVFGVILTVAVISDGLAYAIAAAPITLVCGLRLWRRHAWRAYEVGLLATTAIAVGLSLAIARGARAAHGASIYRLSPTLASIEDVPRYARSAIDGGLTMFGTVQGEGSGALGYVAVVVHGLGLAFVLAVVVYIAWRWVLRREDDLVNELLLVSILSDLGAFVLISHVDTNKYLIPAFFCSAVLAGRVGTDFLARRGPRVAAAGVALAYFVILFVNLGAPVAPTSTAWEAWLLDHQLYSGLGSYWQSSAATVETGGRLHIVAIVSDGATAGGYAWESNASWFNEAELGDVRFVVFDVTDHRFGIDRASMERVFGPATDVERFGNVEVLVWDRNLAPSLRH